MNRKYLPLAYMLTAGAVTGVVSYVLKFSLLRFLWSLVVVLFVFYIIGCIVKNLLDKFDEEIQEAQALEDDESGAVIEKIVDNEDEYDYYE